jgi:hypothetical protein
MPNALTGATDLMNGIFAKVKPEQQEPVVAPMVAPTIQ